MVEIMTQQEPSRELGLGLFMDLKECLQTIMMSWKTMLNSKFSANSSITWNDS